MRLSYRTTFAAVAFRLPTQQPLLDHTCRLCRCLVLRLAVAFQLRFCSSNISFARSCLGCSLPRAEPLAQLTGAPIPVCGLNPHVPHVSSPPGSVPLCLWLVASARRDSPRRWVCPLLSFTSSADDKDHRFWNWSHTGLKSDDPPVDIH